MKQKLLFTNVISKLLVLGCFLLCNTAFSANFFSKVSGNWNAPGTWSSTDNGTALSGTAVEGTNYPGPNDVVYIRANHTITINISLARCSSLTFGSTTVAQNALAHTANIVLGNATSGTFSLTVSGNLSVLTSNTTTTTTEIKRILNIYKNDPAINSTLTIEGNIVVGNSSENYLNTASTTTINRRTNSVSFGTVTPNLKFGPNVIVNGNVNMFSHQIPGPAGNDNFRYNLSSVYVLSGKMTLAGTNLMTAGLEETTGKGYIKSFRKGTAEGQSTNNRFYMEDPDNGATLEFNHHTDNPFYTTGNIAISLPIITQGIVIFKSTTNNTSVIPATVYRHLVIDNPNGGASVGPIGSGGTTNNTVKVNNSLSLVAGTFNSVSTDIVEIGNNSSTFVLYMKGGAIVPESSSNFFLSSKIDISYSDNATAPGQELGIAMGTGTGFVGNNIDELILDTGNVGVVFDFATPDVEADIIRFRRPSYVLSTGIFHAQVFIEITGNNSVYNGCVFDTPRLDILNNCQILTPQTIRTATGSGASYNSEGVVNLGIASEPITLTLGADLTTTDVNMLGTATLVRASGVLNSYFNVHGFFKLGDDTSHNLTSNSILVLKSLAYETARVSKQESFNASINGIVHVERYLTNDGGDGGGRYWRLLTAPVLKTIASEDATLWKQWQNDGVSYQIGDLGYGTDVWGSNPTYTMAANGMYYLNPGTHNFRKYDSTLSAAGGWTNVSNTYTENLFTTTTNNAFLTFIIKPFGQGVTVTDGQPNTSSPGSVSTVLLSSGKLRFGAVPYTISKNRYHLIGNPYASPINISTLLSSNPNRTTGKVWVLDSALGAFGGYVTYDGSIWSDTGSIHSTSLVPVIQSGEGFFIKTANIGTPTTNFNIVEALKNETIPSSSVFGRSAQTTTDTSFELMRVNLKKVTNNLTSHEDGSTVKFYAGGINEVDASDADKFSNPSGTISLINGTTKLAIENRALVVAGDEVFVNVSNATANSNYKLHIYTENFTFSGIASLYDLKLGTTTVMPIDGSVFEYPFTVTSDATTQGTRFKIVFGNSVLSVDDIANIYGVKVYPNPVAKSGTLTLNLGTLENNMYNYRITNLLGQSVQTGKLDKTELNQEFTLTFNAAISAGLYSIEVLDRNVVVNSSKIIIK